ncbi:hypothetical protein [Streptomyces sp. NPDC005773]|uniref:oxidoreductase n=1 Tax=Streptomyces sp. NPDC005773 TaxID=3364727 RepID=UPI0036A912A6
MRCGRTSTASADDADGAEIHGANGYLLHQFLSPNANHRTSSSACAPMPRSTRSTRPPCTAAARPDTPTTRP